MSARRRRELPPRIAPKCARRAPPLLRSRAALLVRHAEDVGREQPVVVLDHRGVVRHRARRRDPRVVERRPVGPVDERLDALLEDDVADRHVRRERAAEEAQLVRRRAAVRRQLPDARRLQLARRLEQPDRRAGRRGERAVGDQYLATVGVVVADVQLALAAGEVQARRLPAPHGAAEDDVLRGVVHAQDGPRLAAQVGREPRERERPREPVVPARNEELGARLQRKPVEREVARRRRRVVDGRLERGGVVGRGVADGAEVAHVEGGQAGGEGRQQHQRLLCMQLPSLPPQ